MKSNCKTIRYLKYPDTYYLIPRMRWGTLPFQTTTMRIIVLSWRGWAHARHKFDGDPFFYPEENQLTPPKPELTEYGAQSFLPFNSHVFPFSHGR